MMRQPAAEGAQGAAGCGMGMTMMQGMCTPVVSMAELASHNAESDCWVGYGGRAYDITSYIPNHKNYQKLIVPLCGTAGEFKAAFEGKHGMSKVDVLEGQPMMGALLQ